MKKGFTLIELLAVIIILAIIALIATPIVLNVVEDAREKANKNSAYGVLDGARLYYAESMLDSEKSKEMNGTTDILSKIGLNGARPEKGNVYINNNGEIKIAVVYGKKCYTKDFTATDLTVSEDIENCAVSNPSEKPSIGIPIIDKAKALVYNGETCKTDGTTYQYMNGCYLKGTQANNYIWFSGFLYRIMGINSDGSVRLITEENVTVIPYNVANNINFTGSHVEKWLNEYFLTNLKGIDKIVDGKFCQGAPVTTEPSRIDCTGGTEITKKVGLLTVDEINLSDVATSYLKNNQFFWTMSPYNATSVWYVVGNANNIDVSSMDGVRPIINVKSETVITKGDGSLSNSYILNEDKTENVTGKLNEKSSSGEYVKLANKVYRVVGKNNDGTTKLILDSYYQETAGASYELPYGSNNIFSITSGIGQKLNTSVLEYLVPASDAINLAKIKTDSKWYQNKFDSGYSYAEAIKENSTPITATVGLINIGEILSGQSASILTKNYTTNSRPSNTIEYWTLTPYTAVTKTWSVNKNGYSSYYDVSNMYGVRPVININSDVNIIRGSGILSNPYEI